MDRDDALLELLARLKAQGYRFHAVTPATHARVLRRPVARAPTLREVFGWNRPFERADIDPAVAALMEQAGIMREEGATVRSALRVASLGEGLFLHSAFPTDERDAVFFGPDTYRFVRFVRRHWPADARDVVDMGAGSGVGGIAAARLAPNAQVTLVDINPRALELARVNARAAGVAVELREDLPAGADLVIANPPYMIDTAARAYRDGGELLGGAVALEWVREALARLAPGGTLLLYTGVAMVEGTAPLLAEIGHACAEAGASLQIEEIDPDVFGEELDQPAYAAVERIAAIGAVIRKP